MPLGKTIWFSDTDVMIANTKRNALPTISSNKTSGMAYNLKYTHTERERHQHAAQVVEV